MEEFLMKGYYKTPSFDWIMLIGACMAFLQDDDNPEINIEDLQDLEEFLTPEVPDNSNKIKII
ncbi:unnamed protein product [Acanthoscelides obtectus]|uniref:Uncharacterized protein n=1 Tax=Acanthoscelides obtectus TaxID=200917 RepID=A0A9P0KX24_ACAOB|nr:unnamed protein product [Acanthoscelides obtectus]CAK1672121.1 hypothetical protein AOBTE_LOCUS28659 [Acanthoscelides obtectus]